MADLEKTSERISAAGLFQVRQQESKAGEQGMYRKSGECAGLRKAAGQHQAAVSFFGQRGCAILAGGNALFGELARTRTPPLCRLPICSSFAIPRSPCCSGLLWQGEAMRSPLKLLGKAAHSRGQATAARAAP